MNPLSEKLSHRKATSRTARFAVVALAAGALGATTVATLSSAAAPTIESANVPHFAGALVNQSSRSLYVLSDERGAKLHCTTACLSSWLPLEVSTVYENGVAWRRCQGKDRVRRSRKVEEAGDL